MKIAIVDDEQKWIEEALDCVREQADCADSIDIYFSGVSFLSKVEEYEVVIMDIEMPEKDGFDTILEYKSQYKDSIILILTTHLEAARKGYLVDAFRYIDKGNMKEEIEEAFDKIKQLIKRNQYYVTGKKDNITKNIPVKDILYFETKAKGVIIHTSTDSYRCDEKINCLEEKLSKLDFFRYHKSFLINMLAVQKLDKQFAYFVANRKAYISVRKYVETKRKYINAKKKYASM